MANLTSQQELYRWSVMTIDDQSVTSSAALEIQPNLPFAKANNLDAVFVCAGVNVRKNWNAPIGAGLRRLAAANLPLGGLCTASYLLAKAGVLDDHRCTVHWEYLSSLREEFPRLTVKDDIFEIDRKRYTCAGGTAPLDLMLYSWPGTMAVMWHWPSPSSLPWSAFGISAKPRRCRCATSPRAPPTT